jgi:hypothetical protein
MWARGGTEQHPTLALLSEGLVEGADGILLHVREHVRVDVEGDRYRGVPEHLGNDLGVDVAGEEEGGARMPEVVEADRRQAGAPEQGLQEAVAEFESRPTLSSSALKVSGIRFQLFADA